VNRMFKTIRLLTATDLHQFKLHYRSLAVVVKEQQPDAVALEAVFPATQAQLCLAPKDH